MEIVRRKPNHMRAEKINWELTLPGLTYSLHSLRFSLQGFIWGGGGGGGTLGMVPPLSRKVPPKIKICRLNFCEGTLS